VFDKDNAVIKVYGSRFVDTGGGFLLEEKVGDPDDQEQVYCNIKIQCILIKLRCPMLQKTIVEEPQPILHELDKPKCKECNEHFNDSFLHTTYDYPVCDTCR
jgi:DNA-repair protein complementing XP-A cells